MIRLRAGKRHARRAGPERALPQRAARGRGPPPTGRGAGAGRADRGRSRSRRPGDGHRCRPPSAPAWAAPSIPSASPDTTATPAAARSRPSSRATAAPTPVQRRVPTIATRGPSSTARSPWTNSTAGRCLVVDQRDRVRRRRRGAARRPRPAAWRSASAIGSRPAVGRHEPRPGPRRSAGGVPGPTSAARSPPARGGPRPRRPRVRTRSSSTPSRRGVMFGQPGEEGRAPGAPASVTPPPPLERGRGVDAQPERGGDVRASIRSRAPVEVGDRAGHPPHPVQPARRQPSGAQHVLEQPGGVVGQRRHRVELAGGEQRRWPAPRGRRPGRGRRGPGGRPRPSARPAAGRTGRRPSGAAPRRAGRTGRAAARTAGGGSGLGSPREQWHPPGRLPAPHGHGFIAATSRNRAGIVADAAARAMRTTPSSSGWRSASSTRAGNSASSSRNSTPLLRGADLAGPEQRRAPADQRDRRRAVVRRPERRRADQPGSRAAGSPAAEWMRVVSRASASASAGSSPGRRAASIVLPAPGGPRSSRWCPPAAATSSA